jgi:hypothetical protein
MNSAASFLASGTSGMFDSILIGALLCQCHR